MDSMTLDGVCVRKTNLGPEQHGQRRNRDDSRASQLPGRTTGDFHDAECSAYKSGEQITLR